jgi:hypothetical protein
MSETARKFILYFLPLRTYWRLVEPSSHYALAPGPEGHYPLPLYQRVKEGHYADFDAMGLPVRFRSDKTTYHNYTTLCSFALANWERYIETGHSEYAAVLVNTAKYMLETSEVLADGSVLLHDERDGSLSAMYQGRQ